MAALNIVRQLIFHVVAQIVEAEFIIGAVSNIAIVRLAAFRILHIGENLADRQTEESINLSHPVGIAAGQIIVDRHKMCAASGQSIQVHRRRGYKRFTFTGLHLRNLALMQHNTANQLHVIMPHIQHALTRFTHGRKRLGQNIIQRCAVIQHFAESFRLILQDFIAHARDDFFLPINTIDNRLNLAHRALMAGAEQSFKKSTNRHSCLQYLCKNKTPQHGVNYHYTRNHRNARQNSYHHRHNNAQVKPKSHTGQPAATFQHRD